MGFVLVSTSPGAVLDGVLADSVHPDADGFYWQPGVMYIALLSILTISWAESQNTSQNTWSCARIGENQISFSPMADDMYAITLLASETRRLRSPWDGADSAMISGSFGH
jgi:hypothetical protein